MSALDELTPTSGNTGIQLDSNLNAPVSMDTNGPTPATSNNFTDGVTPGSILDGQLSSALQHTGTLYNGKTLFDNSQIGFILGVDSKDGAVKFFIGSPSASMDWDGTSLTITGTITGGTIQTAASGRRITITGADNFIKAYDSGNNLFGTFGGSTDGTSRILDLNIPSGSDIIAQRIIGNNTTGTALLLQTDSKGYQYVEFRNENTNSYRTTNSVPMLDFFQLGTGSAIRFRNTNPASDGKVFDITQSAVASTEPIFKIQQDGITQTNFRMIWREVDTGFTIWVSNGTTPNGNLTGALGDICHNGLNGHTFWCSTAGTTWTQI